MTDQPTQPLTPPGPGDPQPVPGQPMPGKPQKRLYRPVTMPLWLLLVIAVAVWLMASTAGRTMAKEDAAGLSAPGATVTATETETVTEVPTDEPTDEPTQKPEPKKPEPEPTLTKAQEQAIGTAEDYLDGGQHFSRKGLIDQLKFEGFSRKLATFAVNHIKVNWNKQAAGAAEDYLDHQHFSRSGLIDQLEYEGYTHAQAVYGVKKAGL
jgi:hypothetical protein